jgi:hypothetical protein
MMLVGAIVVEGTGICGGLMETRWHGRPATVL